MMAEPSEKSARDETDPLLACIDKGLDCFGKDVKLVIYWRLGHEFHMSKGAIPNDPEKFSSNLNEMFGACTKLVEKRIVMQLKERFGTLDLSNCDLTSAIKLASQSRR
ncbi:MAG: hypothetical protein JRN52_00155 [Nitrososphaerota archaeon]|nr:hypothetical protein [Nitrososphaerota archaeon]